MTDLRDMKLDDLLGEMVLFGVTDPERAHRAVAEIKRRPLEPWSDAVLVEKVAQGLYEAASDGYWPEWSLRAPSDNGFWLAEARRVLGEPQ